jgi:hypothetical protein
MTNNSLRELLGEKNTYTGKWTAVYLETVPNSLERLAAIVAVQGDDGQVEVIRVLSQSVISKLLGKNSKGIEIVLDTVILDIEKHLNHNSLETLQLGFSGFHLGGVRRSGAASMQGIISKAIGLTTSLPTDLDEETQHQQYFSTRLKEKLFTINPDFKQYIDQPYRLNNKTVKYGIVTPSLIGHYHGMGHTKASYNSAIAKMVELEDLALDGLLGTEFERDFFFSYGAGTKLKIDSRMEEIRQELFRRGLPCSTFAGVTELAEHLNSRISPLLINNMA